MQRTYIQVQARGRVTLGKPATADHYLAHRESDGTIVLEPATVMSQAEACYAAVFAFYAAKMDVDYDAFEVTAVADLDLRGHMIEDAPPAGFKSVRMETRIVSSATQEELDTVNVKAIRGCPGISTLRDPVKIESKVIAEEPSGSPALPITES